MTFCHRHRGAALIASALLAPQVLSAAEKQGGLLGWVENTQGIPVAGAVISVFGKGINGGSLVTLSDTTGQFFLPALPAGSYTLRALGRGHEPAAAQTITVLPLKDSVYTVSLTPVGEAGEKGEEEGASSTTEASRNALASEELKWLLRHKRRSVLEYRDDEVSADEGGSEPPSPRADLAEQVAAYVPALAGTFEVVATPAVIGEDGVFTLAEGVPTSQGVLRLHGKMADIGEWRLGGLITESESTAWRMAAEFVLTPGGGHEVQTGGGYGTRYVRPLAGDGPGATLDARSVGSLFAHDTWRISDSWTAGVGARYSYVGFLQDANSVDGYLSFERALGRGGRLHGSVAAKTLAPGGDLLTLSTLGAAPVLSLARIDDALRAERTTRYELGVDRSAGGTTVGAFLFREDIADQLLNLHGFSAGDTLRIVNAGDLSVQGVGMSLDRRFGSSVTGSLAYTYGRAARRGAAVFVDDVPGFSAAFEEASFHDLVARVETFINLTDTRLSAYYRLNTLDPEGDRTARSVANARFDVRLTQGLPFLQPLTRAEWELLVAVRNLFYDDVESGMLDEMAVVHPPKRVMGGFAVKF